MALSSVRNIIGQKVLPPSSSLASFHLSSPVGGRQREKTSLSEESQRIEEPRTPCHMYAFLQPHLIARSLVLHTPFVVLFYFWFVTASFGAIFDGTDVFMTRLQEALCAENGAWVSGIHTPDGS